jgi:hypothetical protein
MLTEPQGKIEIWSEQYGRREVGRHANLLLS